MKIDFYTKAVLTLIAIALWGIFPNPFLQTKEVVASSGIVDVNLKQIDGGSVNRVLDVNIKEVSGRSIFNTLPVEVRK